MIWLWLWNAIRFLGRLVLPPKSPEPVKIVPTIDPNAPCPVCGHTKGSLKSVQMDGERILVQHACEICGARHFVKPITTVDAGKIVPAVKLLEGK